MGSETEQRPLGHGDLARGTRRARLRPDRMADLRGGVLARRRTAAREPERHLPARPHADGIRHGRAEEALPAEDGDRRGGVVPGLVRAGRRLRHGGDPRARRAPGGSLRDQWPEDLVDARGVGRLVLRHVPHRSRLRAPPRPHVHPGAAEPRGHHGTPDPAARRSARFRGDLLRQREGAGGLPPRRRGQGLEGGDGHRRLRARPDAAQPGAIPADRRAPGAALQGQSRQRRPRPHGA
jgi:hypothetical protein